MKQLLVVVLLVAAVWQFGAAGWIHAKAWLAQYLIDRAWVEVDEGSRKALPWPWADTWPVARLQVPRLGIEQIILAGGHGRAMAFGPGWIEGTALPGTPGRSVLSAHRDTHFSFLRELQTGDEILIRPPNGAALRYAVEQREIVKEEETWPLVPGDEYELVLITCYPFDAIIPGGSLRYVVTARHPADAN